MLRFLIKLFVVPFYKSNAGFFLFFFFFFFGVVNSGSLIAYHLSLMISMLQSPVILIGVMILWWLYHLKCIYYCLKMINSAEGSFLYNLQIVAAKKQIVMLFCLHIMLYAPVLIYAFMVMIVGWKKGYYDNVAALLVFQLVIGCSGAVTYYRRLNNWLLKRHTPELSFLHKRPKPFLLFLLYYFGFEKKVLFLSLKSLSLLLLYIALVLNKVGYDNDFFIFFYQLILLTHTVFAFLGVEFLEKRLSFYRNLPVGLVRCAAVYFLTYIILLLPELLYLLLNAKALMPVTIIVSYYSVAVATLCLLTAIQYSEAINRDEYVKIVFALFFVATFALHAQVFLVWCMIQFSIAVILFWNGFYKYENAGQY